MLRAIFTEWYCIDDQLIGLLHKILKWAVSCCNCAQIKLQRRTFDTPFNYALFQFLIYLCSDEWVRTIALAMHTIAGAAKQSLDCSVLFLTSLSFIYLDLPASLYRSALTLPSALGVFGVTLIDTFVRQFSGIVFAIFLPQLLSQAVCMCVKVVRSIATMIYIRMWTKSNKTPCKSNEPHIVSNWQNKVLLHFCQHLICQGKNSV